jgi:uncharacterized membrane protein YeaQ/YmgE (transglycosylase-associated protein family)
MQRLKRLSSLIARRHEGERTASRLMIRQLCAGDQKIQQKDCKGEPHMLNILSASNLLTWVIVGAAAGLIASIVVRGGSLGIGISGDILVGVIGALLGGVVLSQLLPDLYGFTGGVTTVALGSLIVAFIGAAILLVIVRLVTGLKHTSVVESPPR